MESVLYQLGYPIVKRDVEKTEYFVLEHSTDLLKQPAHLFRNHHYYCPSSAIQALSEYNGEAMIFVYKNALMTQFHPEKTADGLDMIQSYFF
jgi:imidazoleglycerol phosphate synthase glutamine amidotransferase subunit HisH